MSLLGIHSPRKPEQAALEGLFFRLDLKEGTDGTPRERNLVMLGVHAPLAPTQAALDGDFSKLDLKEGVEGTPMERQVRLLFYSSLFVSAGVSAGGSLSENARTSRSGRLVLQVGPDGRH